MKDGEHTDTRCFFAIVDARREFFDDSPANVPENLAVQFRIASDLFEYGLYGVGEQLPQPRLPVFVIVISLVKLILSFGIENDWHAQRRHLARAAALATSHGVPRDGSASDKAARRSSSA